MLLFHIISLQVFFNFKINFNLFSNAYMLNSIANKHNFVLVLSLSFFSSDGKEAEEVFMKRHPRYQELVDKYGAPDAATSEVKVAEVKAGLLNINIALVSSNFPSGISGWF